MGDLVSFVVELVGVCLAGVEFGGFENDAVFAEGVGILVLPDFLPGGVKKPDLHHARVGQLVGDHDKGP